MSHRLSFREWQTKYDRREDERRVYARCDNSVDDHECEGWVLTYRDAICGWEYPLTPEQREEGGVPDPHPEIPLIDLYTGEPR